MILGPVPCQGCRRPVVWNGWEWRNPSGHEHICDRTSVRNEVSVGASQGYTARVGISDANTDTMCDARPVADTSQAGVSRLEVSAP